MIINNYNNSNSKGLRRREAAIQAKKIVCNEQDHSDPQQASVFICLGCSRDCKSRLGLENFTATQDDQIIPIHVRKYIHDLLRYYFIVYGPMDANNNSKAAFKEKIYYLES